MQTDSEGYLQTLCPISPQEPRLSVRRFPGKLP
jgi:hypothetical protein